MSLFDSLDWYRRGHIPVDAAARATGVSVPSQRLLQKLHIIEPASQELKNSKRLLDIKAFKRLACIEPLQSTGLSFAVSGKIIYADTFLNDVVFEVVDPMTAMFDFQGDYDPKMGIPPLLPKPDPHGWFDPKKRVQTEDTDHWVEILNHRYVRVATDDKAPGILGEIPPDGSDFVLWYGPDFSDWFGYGFDRLVDDRGKTVVRDRTSPNYKSKRPSADDLNAAKYVWRNPTSKVSINVGVALRAALRRLLLVDGAIEQQD